MQSELVRRITSEDDQSGGRPCIRWNAHSSDRLLELLGAGADVDGILSDYPFL